MRKRKEFEDAIRKNRLVMANWFKYTKWEENQGEIQRARLAIFITESHVFPMFPTMIQQDWHMLQAFKYT
jgi:hypothetical protein